MPTCSSLLLLQSAVPRVQRGVQVQRSSQVQWFETEQTSAMRRGVFKTLTLYTGPPKVKSTSKQHTVIPSVGLYKLQYTLLHTGYSCTGYSWIPRPDPTAPDPAPAPPTAVHQQPRLGVELVRRRVPSCKTHSSVTLLFRTLCSTLISFATCSARRFTSLWAQRD